MIYSKYSKRKNFQLFDLKNKIISDSSFILIFTLFICGLILSTAISFSSDVNTSFRISNFITKYMFSTENYLHSAILLLFISVIQILISIIFSLSCIGTPILFILPFFAGLLSGFVSGYLINMYGTNGMIFYLIAICPTYTIINTILLNLFNKSQHLSYIIRNMIFGNNVEYKISEYFKRYLLYCVTTLVFIVLAVLIQLLLTNVSNNLLQYN